MLSRKKRFKVLRRDNFTCVYCGKSTSATRLHVDHRISRRDGGTDAMENLATSCVDCNLGKGALSCGNLESEITWEDLFWDRMESRGLLSPPAPKKQRDAFSPRQIDVIRAAALGLSQSGIADHLKIARGTAAVHLQIVYRKLGIKSPSAGPKLTFWAIDNGYGPEEADIYPSGYSLGEQNA